MEMELVHARLKALLFRKLLRLSPVRLVRKELMRDLDGPVKSVTTLHRSKRKLGPPLSIPANARPDTLMLETAVFFKQIEMH